MNTTRISTGRKQGFLAGVVSFAICMSAGLLPAPPIQALPGEVFTNGTIPNAANKQPGPIPSNLVGFLFEPEVPFASLKSVPTWNELEQLLDNPYLVTLDTATPGNEQGYPSYRATGVTRRPGFGVTLPPLLVDPLNYNPTTGEEMRLLNPDYTGGQFSIPDELIQCSTVEGLSVPGCDGTRSVADAAGVLVTTGPFDPNRYVWRFKTVAVTPGVGRVLPGQAEISYNAPFAKDRGVGTALPTCIVTAETVPPEGATMCGGDPGEPGYIGLGQPLFPIGAAHRAAYSTPAVPGVLSVGQTATGLLYDPGRRAPEAFAGFILPRDAQGRFGLRKPSLRVATAGGRTNNPNFLVNRTDTGAVAADPAALTPSNENDYVRNRNVAIALGKALFWDMQVGSDGVQSCGTCHFNGTGTDTRTKNQVNPNHLGGDLTFTLMQPNERNLVPADFPLHKLINHEVAGDPACATPLLASVNAGVLENNFPLGKTDLPVCDAANVLSDTNDVVSSMGVVFSPFTDIAPIGALSNPLAFQPAVNGVRAVMPDVRTAGALDPIPGFQGIRRVEPRNTPTMQAAAFNFDNFWDGRARHDFNGGGVFGAADPQSHVFVSTGETGALVPTRQLIRFASIASLATGPGLSEFEMSFAGRNWSKVGKKLLQAGITPLANQLVDPTDSALGPYSNQAGASAACLALTGDNRSGSWSGTNVSGKPGLCISYRGLIRQAYYPALWRNTGQHLNGCYTNSDPLDVRTPKCSSVGVTPSIPVLSAGTVVNGTADPFDGYVLTIANGTATPANTNQFTHMEGNFSLFWGLSVNLWVGILVPDNTPFDQVLEANAGAFETLGEPGERGLVNDQLTCGLAGADPNYCFTELGNFKRDSNAMATQGVTGEGGVGGHPVPSPGTRTPDSNQPDPLLGLDLFFASNLSLKNPNFRTGRCGECHAVPTLTDHTMPFTFKAQLRDFIKEFVTGQPGVETLVEPLGRLRVISGFLLESEMNENGQDGVERRIANQSIVPCPADGLAYPGGLEPGTGQGFGTCAGAAASFFDNGIYNLGVRPISDDLGRGGDDAFGWPLSLSALMLKNLAGPAFEPGFPLPNFDPANGFTGGLFEESSQDQQINPGVGGDPVASMLPAYLGPFTNQINVGDSAPELDEVFGGVNTLTDIGMLEGFLDTLGPFNTAGVLNESLNMGDTTLMGTWPNANRVGRMGSFKAPQLRNVELTGPYFHNGGKLTLRQVVDFYSRGGDFPMTNAAHRDFNIINQNIEVQSNLSEAEKVALVDFLLELTDERNRFDRAPFDHPEVIVPIDGFAPDNRLSRTALLANPTMFMDVPAVGAAGQLTPEPAFLNVKNVRVSGTDAEPGSTACDYVNGVVSHYCH